MSETDRNVFIHKRDDKYRLWVISINANIEVHKLQYGTVFMFWNGAV